MISLFLVLTAGVIVGGLISHFFGQAFSALKDWRADNRRFVCDACKSKSRRKNGYTPFAIDLEPRTGLIPLNLLLCRKCLPNA